MSDQLRRRLGKLEAVHRTRGLSTNAHSESRRWALLNLYLHAAAGLDTRHWSAALKELPPRGDLSPARPLSASDRQTRILALLCHEARQPGAYRPLLRMAVELGFADERQARWIREEGLIGEHPANAGSACRE